MKLANKVDMDEVLDDYETVHIKLFISELLLKTPIFSLASAPPSVLIASS